MPRRSASSLATPQIDAKKRKLDPPADLSREATAVWRALVDSLSADHFTPSDAPLLRSYCEATAVATQAAAELNKGAVVDGRLNPWLIVSEKATRTQIALSMRLRLSPQSRISRQKAGTTPDGGRAPKPWEAR